MEDNEELSVFKSYLRGLLRTLIELKEANKSGDNARVEELIQKLIDDTQSGLED